MPLYTEAAGATPPDAFGPFRVLHQVGAGTLGPVFRAFDADRARLVAVKVLRLDVPPERLHQLVVELERLIAAGLTHPAVAAPIATGTDGLVVYLAQDYVSADSLDVVLRDEGPSQPSDAIRVAVQLAGALDVAAAAQVHHGVLHPRDVLIAQHDTRLTGLGVAGAIEKIGVAAPRRRPYAAPERMSGGAWDRRADVFSLAALIHEMLWGRRLTAIGDEAADALTDLPGADLPRLQAAFARALAFNPVDRFDTATDFAAAIQRAFPGVTLDVIIAPDHFSGAGRQIDPIGPKAGEVDEDANVELSPYTWEEDATLTMTLDARDGDATGRLEPEVTDNVTAPVESGPLGDDGPPYDAGRTDEYAHAAAAAQLPFEVDLRDGADGSLPRSGVEEGRQAAGAEGAGEESGLRVDLDSPDLELRPPEAARYDGGEIAPPLQPEPAPDAAEPVAIAASARRLPPFQPYGSYSPPTLEGRDEPDEPRRSLIGPLAAALLFGLALGFAGGYTLGGRSGTPAAASAPPETAPSQSASPAPPPGREFTEAAVGNGTATPPASAPGASPATTVPPAGGQGRSGRAGERPGATVERGSATGAAAAASATGRLLVRSTPAGARVFVDGQEHGRTPATIRDLVRGTHRVRITHDGYAAEERGVAITTAQPGPTLTVVLKPVAPPARGSTVAPAPPAAGGTSVATLTILSRPDGARVFLDDRLVGTTPLSLPQVAAGQHAVRLEREGYRNWSTSIRVTGGQPQRVAASLEQ